MVALTYGGTAVAAFVIGAIPFSWLIGKIGVGVDLRRVGSGNPGATNLYRTAGLIWGIPALVLDVAKGFVPPLLAGWFFPEVNAFAIVAGAAAVAGHMWTPFLGFRGGKGVATAAGTFLALAPLVLVIGLATFFVVTAVSRYVSVGSIAATVVAFSASFILPATKDEPVEWVLVAFCGLCAAGIIFAHRKNISRLLAGTETKLGSKGKGNR